jgi:hypothetical protein
LLSRPKAQLGLTPEGVNKQCGTISHSAERARQLLDEGDMAGAETRHRFLNAIERLQAKAPPEGEKVH